MDLFAKFRSKYRSKLSGEDQSLTFAEVFPLELHEIHDSRRKRQVKTPHRETEVKALDEALGGLDGSEPQRPLDRDLIGLAFSGGGIRSATFCLGVIQGLASRQLLRLVDYLSTVSGGGYIGSWLSSWAYYFREQSPHRQIAEMEKELAADAHNPGVHTEPKLMHHLRGYNNQIVEIERELNEQPHHIGDPPEPRQVQFLRKYSNYLTPRMGVLSGDTLAFAGTYVRNVMLNQIILVSALMAWLAVPRILSLAMEQWAGDYAVEVSVGLAILSLIWICYHIARNLNPKTYDSPAGVLYKVAAPHVLFCFLSAYVLWQMVTGKVEWGTILLQSSWSGRLLVIGVVAAIFFVLWVVAILLTPQPASPVPERVHETGSAIPPPPSVTPSERVLAATRWSPAIWATLAGLVAGTSVLVGSHIFARWPDDAQDLLTFGVPLGTAMVLVVGVIHVGLIGRAFRDSVREWWARMGGLVVGIAIYWFAICLVTLFVPGWLVHLWHWLWGDHHGFNLLIKTLGSLGITGAVTGWIGVTLRGLFVAKSARTGGPTESSGSSLDDLMVRVAPTVFAVGLIILLSCVLYKIEPRIMNANLVHGPNAPWLQLAVFALLLYGLSRLLGARVDVNEFSLHCAYRNRIVRCYLGATNPWRKPQMFTGFDEKDNIFLHWLLLLGAPFHILNCTLNVVKGKELALQARKARSFAFTPLYSGFDYQDDQQPSDPKTGTPISAEAKVPAAGQTKTTASAYRLTKHCSWNSLYPGARLGSAMAISGAAVSPNMGHYSTGPMSFLLTVFGARLGFWLGNPRHKKDWESGYPRSSWRALMSELTGSTNDDGAEVYLSDGGHFDNLGVYELVRRRCRLIISVDAGADPDYVCGDLASVVEKCRVDFRTDIKIDVSHAGRNADVPFFRGDIYYPGDALEKPSGTLIYLKPCLIPKLPQDVLAYARQHASFPHQSTVDQFFDESQFESYRALGFACTVAAIDVISEAMRA